MEMEIIKGYWSEMTNTLSEMRSILNRINKGINRVNKGSNALPRGRESHGHIIRMARDKMPRLSK